MTAIGRITHPLGLIVPLVLGWTLLAHAGPLGPDPGGVDPLAKLAPETRTAAKALGEARRHLESGERAAARAALARASSVPSLAGYVEWVRVRLLLEENEHEAAYQLATRTREKMEKGALRAALGVLQGEALALAGQAEAAELAWSDVIESAAEGDAAIRQSVSLAIVASRQRTGSLDATRDPLALLDEGYSDTLARTRRVPIESLSPEQVLERAEAALDRGHPAEALTLYDRAVSQPLDPARARAARVGRARALFRARKYEGAAQAYRALLPDIEARFWLARSLARTGAISESIEMFEQVARGSDEAFASWALYLKGTLHEDRGEVEQAIDAFHRAARFVRFPERVRQSLWREGWAQYKRGQHEAARKAFSTLAEKTEEAIDQLRPRYWAARAAIASGAKTRGQDELRTLARDFPLTYYGWRAQERLALDGAKLIVSKRALEEGSRQVDDEAIERAALLIEAGLDDFARDELRFAAQRALGFVDRTQVGLLLARVGDYHRASELVVTAYGDSLARGLQPGREALWWLSWPPAYRETIDAALSAEPSIDPELVWAIMREESHYRVDARSAVGALGLLQLMPTTAEELAREKGLTKFSPEDLFDPQTNILLGATYLEQLGTRFDGRMSAAVGSYNAGPYRVSTWLEGEQAEWEDDVWVENIPYDQTRAYVKRVLRSLHVYKSFYR